ncbi:MAG: hypothetical protein DMF70_16080 [Acidobacteria bacterium]|jgi:hypothetical protein|nr:MAG: hypothetical protein DMF70_16080 [Acidobacteriota bacterium]
MGIIFGTYDTIAIAGPIMVWWEKKLEAGNKLPAASARESGIQTKGRGDGARTGVSKSSRAARV